MIIHKLFYEALRSGKPVFGAHTELCNRTEDYKRTIDAQYSVAKWLEQLLTLPEDDPTRAAAQVVLDSLEPTK
jgi:hypothetical protein